MTRNVSLFDFVVASLVLAASITVLEAAVGQNNTRQGICSLEVPTVDLLSPEDRRGVIPPSNGTRPGYSRIEVCCHGWERKPHSHYFCQPICENGCENGNCTAPNVCVCKRGYVKNDLGVCIPTCPAGCLNGVCTMMGSCSCNAGFELSRDRTYCTPRCSGGCGLGGVCSGPETCTCLTGHYLNSQTRKCEYFCEGGCQGGECIAPNQCQCRPGYRRERGGCVPECVRGCTNGNCTAPNVCTCAPGWTLNPAGNVCEAHCTEPCLNAICSGPNVCTCMQGYTKEGSGSPHKCVAHCPGGCPNGVCSAPNFCICNPGFVKERRGSMNCVRRLRRSLMHFDLIPEQEP